MQIENDNIQNKGDNKLTLSKNG